MSAQRWTRDGRVLLLNGQPALFLERYNGRADGASHVLKPYEADELARRIVALLNATELTSSAVAALQVAVMEHAALHRGESDSVTGKSVELSFDALTDTLNHTVRMYVELDEEASIALDGGTQ